MAMVLIVVMVWLIIPLGIFNESSNKHHHGYVVCIVSSTSCH